MVLFVHLSTLLSLLTFLPISSPLRHGCPQECGGVPIPFPFGVGRGCSLPGFRVSCTHHHPFLSDTRLRILSISNGQLRVDSTPYVATDCADNATAAVAAVALPRGGPFTFSASANRFVAVGCDTVAIIDDGGDFTSGCVSLCSRRESVIAAAAGCSGVGCCEAAVPEGRRYLSLGAGNMFGYRNVSAFDNCSYAFLAEKGGFEFREELLRGFPRQAAVAMRLEWAVRGRCSDPAAACGENARCVPAVGGSGYLCNCSHGYSGNPYLSGPKGCRDVDECEDPDASPCVNEARCYNKAPGYKCRCPFGSTGDGTKQGSGCRKIFQIVEAVLGTGLGIGLISFFALWFYFALKKRALMKLREQYFRQNGGLLLKQQLSVREGTECARIFSSQELRLATNNYDEGRILGAGAHGTVYKGVLEDGMAVAVKKAKVLDRSQIDHFINEVVILTQINHRNVVKLLGCCLETEVPMLVYEFIPSGTLYEHIHGPNRSHIPWSDRLRIAIETAEALAYLHSAASTSIFHRDVKSSNILLDDNYTAKVSDFGISRLVPLDQTEVPTLVQGTFGYLDPEYFQTSQLTAKSDVYSFGVVLVELLTAQKPVSFERSKEDSNLAMYFLSSLKCKDLNDFIDKDVMREDSIEQVRAVAELARKCLLLRGDKRPTMKEVVQELVFISSFGRHSGDEVDEESEVPSNERSLQLLSPDQDSFPKNLSVSVDLAR